MSAKEKNMDEQPHTTDSQQRDQRFLSVLGELETIKRKYVVEAHLKWYEQHIQPARIAFFLSGILIILLSVSLPYLATLEGVWRTTVLPVVALIVAALTGLSAFFK